MFHKKQIIWLNSFSIWLLELFPRKTRKISLLLLNSLGLRNDGIIQPIELRVVQHLIVRQQNGCARRGVERIAGSLRKTSQHTVAQVRVIGWPFPIRVWNISQRDLKAVVVGWRCGRSNHLVVIRHRRLLLLRRWIDGHDSLVAGSDLILGRKKVQTVVIALVVATQNFYFAVRDVAVWDGIVVSVDVYESDLKFMEI